jgi:hypothetical protein
MAERYDVTAAGETTGRGAAGDGDRGGALLLMLALFALILGLATWRHHHAAAPRPADAPATEFSAGRARQVLAQLLGDGRPHPVGSAADDLVRQRIVGILGGLGLQPRIEEGFACRPQSCATVRNVVAEIPGREPGAVMVAAHYDSVPAGPGASDDTAGVAAILEIARALKAGPAPRHPVVLLLDEGEEAGLLGAVAFEDGSAEASEVKAVVNLEARGTAGPSYMFETSGANGWMIDAWARQAPSPVTTSLAAFLYSQLPNDTDLTIFRRHHIPGLNFAFIGDATHYHTSDDNLAFASQVSLQHQGENALAAVAALAGADLASPPPPGDLVFFDVLSLAVIRWPAGWTVWIALLALALLLAATVVALRRRMMRGGDLMLGLLAPPAMMVLTALLANGLLLVLVSVGALRASWLAHPQPALAAFGLLALLVVAALAPILGRRSQPLGLWAGIWLIWATLGALLAVVAPATSYLWVVPALLAGICGLPAVLRGGARPFSAIAIMLPGAAAALLWFSVMPAIYDGLGVPQLATVAVLAAIALSALAPLIATGGKLGRRLWLPALLLAFVASLWAATQPPFSPQSPRPMSYTCYEDAYSGSTRWVLRTAPPVPPAVQKAAAFGAPEHVFAWLPAGWRLSTAPAPALQAAPPELQVLESTVTAGKRHLRVRLLSHRGAPAATVWVPAAAHPESVKIEGHELPAVGGKRNQSQTGDWYSYGDVTLPPGGCVIDLVLGEPAPQDWYVVDSSPGLPPAGAALLAARPAFAVPIQEGDTTQVSQKVKI